MINVSYVKLKDCCTVVGGATPKRNILKYWGNDVPWVTPKDVSGMNVPVLEDAPEYISHAGFKSCSTYMLPKNSILLTSRAPIGNVAIAGRSMCTNQGFKSLVPGDSVDSAYLYHCIKYLSPQLQALGNGATFKEVSKKVVENFEIPLPPIKEQKRIAAILDKADAIRRKRQQAIELTDQLLRSVFFDMFGDPVTNPKGWKTASLRDASSVFSDGPFGSNLKSSHYTEKGIRVIRLKNIGIGMLIDTDKAFVSKQHYETILKHTCQPGDIVVATLGDPNIRACIIPDSIDKAINKADCVQFRVNPDIGTAEYFSALLNASSFIVLVSHLLHGQTRTRISMGTLREVVVPLPPLEEQKKFTDMVNSLNVNSLRLADSSESMEDLFNSLTQQAFRGDLTNQTKAA